MRIATLDIGTNCVLLLVAEVANDGRRLLEPVLERATITRLGEGVDHNRRLLPAACHRTLTCLAEYAREISRLGVARIAAVGTSALRDAEGGQDFLRRATNVLRVEPRVIDGAEEARLTFAGALSGLSITGNVAVFDVGGGSTEIVVGAVRGDCARHIGSAVSLDIGSVRLFERHVHGDPPTADELGAVEQDIESALLSAPSIDPSATLVGVAGTLTQLAALELALPRYDSALVHGRVLSRETVDRLATRLAASSLAQRRALPGMESARADVIVVGSAIARGVLRYAGAGQVVVSDRGVRWGLAEALATQSA